MNLLYQHLQISFISIVLAILIGGLIGIFMSEYKKISKPFMSIINFVYTIPSISMLGFLIPLQELEIQQRLLHLSSMLFYQW